MNACLQSRRAVLKKRVNGSFTAVSHCDDVELCIGPTRTHAAHNALRDLRRGQVSFELVGSDNDPLQCESVTFSESGLSGSRCTGVLAVAL